MGTAPSHGKPNTTTQIDNVPDLGPRTSARPVGPGRCKVPDHGGAHAGTAENGPIRHRYPRLVPETRSGLLLGVAAYALWGAFPLYWPLLEPGGALEILAHRIVWSAITMGLLVLALSRRAQLRRILGDRRLVLLLAVAAATITSNWTAYIYGVNNGRVVETSLGYFINPLVTVLMGVLVLSERLRPLQWVALGVGFTAVGVLTWDYGRPP